MDTQGEEVLIQESRFYKGIITRFIITITLSNFVAGYYVGLLDYLYIVLPASMDQSIGSLSSQTILNLTFFIFGCLGTASSGFISEKFGRRKVILWNAWINVIICWITIFYGNAILFLLTRILNGFSVGVTLIVPAVFGYEISPHEISGRSGWTTYAQLTIGIFVAYMFGIDAGMRASGFWRALFAIPIIVNLLQIVLLQKFYPWESPRWLWTNNKPEEAEAVLYYLYKPWLVGQVLKGFETDASASRNHESILSSGYGVNSEYQMYRKQKLSLLCTPKYRRLLIIAIVLPILTNFSGINFVLLESTSFFQSLDAGAGPSMTFIQISGFVQIICVLCVFIYIEKVGRKTLLMIGAISMWITNLVIALMIVIDASIIVFACLFVIHILVWNLSYGPALWVFFTEIFNIQAFALQMSINWFVFSIQILVGGFTTLNDPNIIFWIYGAVMAIDIAFIAVVTFETRGRTIKEIKETLLK